MTFSVLAVGGYLWERGRSHDLANDVLGNEKFGIPSVSIFLCNPDNTSRLLLTEHYLQQDIIPALDVCVEIPQSGVIRSLNVHVSASVTLWEYAKQCVL